MKEMHREMDRFPPRENFYEKYPHLAGKPYEVHPYYRAGLQDWADWLDTR